MPMSKNDCRCSIVIPIYNAEKHIEACVRGLQKQIVGQNAEILLIDDGSTDGSGAICDAVCAQYADVRCFHRQNRGVSAARNVGVRHAKGKYLWYLDADDELAPDTIRNVLAFFDTVYDEVDLVTYPIETLYRGRMLPPHFRYRYLRENGVYDLNEHPYIGQTTMNIVVKNAFENNVLFDERQSFSEDQRYCCDVLGDKLKMGFCRDGTYLYHRSVNSSSGQLAGSCYVFEQCTCFFEELFARYDRVPLAFQGLYVNDLAWKLASNMLYPYHYADDAYAVAVERLRTLLRRCDNRVVLEHPQIDFFEKYYFLRLKDERALTCHVDRDGFSLWDGDVLAVNEDSVEMVVTKLFVKDGRVHIDGFLKSVFFQFYTQEVVLCAEENGGKFTRKLPLSDSTHNYYLSHEKTQRFLSFRYEARVDDVQALRFHVYLGAACFPVRFYFMPLVSLSHVRGVYRCQKENVRISLTDDRTFVFRKNPRKREELWLYYDCVGVASDNGLLQFTHDAATEDGVRRYYVLTDARQAASVPKKQRVRFGSRKHKRLLRKCTKLITAYIEEANLFPYTPAELERQSRYFDFEVVYLQHGVLHAVMPWKYSRERLPADVITVSTEEEAALYRRNGFADEALLKTGMPRFAALQRRAAAEKKILFAPSWRQYLVGNYVDRQWVLTERKLLTSTFYKKTTAFLRSPELAAFLEEHDLRLEVKLHPIFARYKAHFAVDSARVSLVDTVADESTYALFVTDFSSYAYNFLYSGVPVVHFIPDIDEFRCGMNGYRELNYPAAFWDTVASSTDALVSAMETALRHETSDTYVHFYPITGDVCQAIYDRLRHETPRKG